MKITYDKQTSLPYFMDQYTINRLENIIEFENASIPKNKELIESCTVLINHLNSIHGFK